MAQLRLLFVYQNTQGIKQYCKGKHKTFGNFNKLVVLWVKENSKTSLTNKDKREIAVYKNMFVKLDTDFLQSIKCATSLKMIKALEPSNAHLYLYLLYCYKIVLRVTGTFSFIKYKSASMCS